MTFSSPFGEGSAFLRLLLLLLLLQGGGRAKKKSKKIVKVQVVDLVNASISRPVAPPYLFSKGRL